MMQLIKSLVKLVIVGALIVFGFNYFYAASLSESNGFKKLKIEMRHTGDGFVVRMKPEGWEVWRLDEKVETTRFYPKTKPDAVIEEVSVDAAAVNPAN